MSEPRRISVATESGAYDVVVGRGLLDGIGDLVREAAPARKIALISDSNVSELFGVKVETKLITAGYDVFPLTFQAGEASKSWAVAGEVLEALAETGLDRTDTIAALGEASLATSRGSRRRRTCGACGSSRFQRRCLRRSTARSAARRGSICAPARTWRALSSSLFSWSRTPT